MVKQTNDELVAFYEIPGRAPGVYMKRGDDTGGDYCRKSIWSVTADGIRNVVQQFDNAMCDLADGTIQPDRQTTLPTLEGVEGAASIGAENAAGREQHHRGFGVRHLDGELTAHRLFEGPDLPPWRSGPSAFLCPVLEPDWA